MAGNRFYNNQNIYVETDYDNIIVVDPNKVVDSDGNVSERLVNHEELVMYANLEAKVLPRSKLVVGSNFQDEVQNIRVGKLGDDKSRTINFMQPQQQIDPANKEKDLYLDTNWTDNLTLGTSRTGDVDSQLLGITNITIKVNTSYAALVNIEMEDVQGRVMFEQGENSPYSAFFQLPYPLFTLTLKGYYGKAIRYELMLKDFNARFDPQSGNYKITTNYISRNYALLSDIPIDALFALPHMYHRTSTIGTDTTSTLPSSSLKDVRTVKSTRGYDAIKNVYTSYKSKGLIDENFPELTLNQMIMKLQNFERYVMEAYGKEDMSVLNDIDEYNNKISEYRDAIYGPITDNWQTKYIDFNSYIVTNIPQAPVLFSLKKELTTGEEGLQNINNAISDLDALITKYNLELNENTTFGEVGECEIGEEKIETSLYSNIKLNDFLRQIEDPNEINFEKTYQLRFNKVPTDIELAEFENKLKTELTIDGYQVDAVTLQVEESNLKKTYFQFGEILDSDSLFNSSFLGKLNKLQDKFQTKKEKVEEKLSEALAKKIQSPDVGLGFKPTIKNVMAVICASADAFLRLMDQVHDDAWEQRENPIRLKSVMSQEKSDGTETSGVGELLGFLSNYGPTKKNTQVVYPWPQYYVTTIDEDGNEQYEDRYPGDPSESGKVKGYLSDVWPEIKFVEEYIKGAVQTQEEKLNIDFENQLKDNPFLGCNAIEFPYQNRPFLDLNIVPFIYEIFERTLLSSNYTKLYRDSGYRDEVYSVLADFEYNNLKESVINSPDLIREFKNFAFSYENFLRYMRSISNNGQGLNWNLFIRGDFTTPYIKNLITKNYGIYKLSYLNGDSTTVESNVDSIEKLKKYIKSDYSSELTFTDGYPFNKLSWVKNNISKGNEINTLEKSNDTSKMFSFNEDKKTIASFSNDDKEYDKKVFSYFDWILNSPNSPSQNTSNLLSSLESIGNTFYDTNLQVINYYNSRQQKDLYLTESFIDYGTKYDTTKNFITKRQTTSLFNTPYFVNSLLKGVDNEKNEIENPYVGLGYICLNALPLSTLREKFKSKINNETSTYVENLNYIFATLNKFSAIHKLPYTWILKYGSIWHRYKRFKNDGVDILDDIWKDFDYKNAYDPISNNTSKQYTFKNYNGDEVSIKQYEQILETVTISLGDNFVTGVEEFDTITYNVDRINNGFYPKVINDFYYYFTKKDIFTGYTSSEILVKQEEKKLKIGNSTKGRIQLNAGKYLMNSWAQFFEIKDNHEFRNYEQDKLLIIPSFGDVKFNQTRFECFNQLGENQQNVTTNPSIYNGSVRSLWASSNYGYFANDMIDKPTPLQYLKHINPTTNNEQSFDLTNSTNVEYSSIEDIFGVFTKEMLDDFENHFLNFCQIEDKYNSEMVNRGNTTFQEFFDSEEIRSQYGGDEPTDEEMVELYALYKNQQNSYSGINVDEYKVNLFNFMESLLMVDKPSLTNDIDVDLKAISNRQMVSFKDKSLNLLNNNDIVLKIGNPSKYDNKVYGSLTTSTSQKIENPYNFGVYVPNSLPTSGGTTTLSQSISNYPNAWSAMTNYVGEFYEDGFKYGNSGSYLTDFFVDMGFEFTENNVKLLSNLIKIYATKKSENTSYSKDDFIGDLNTFIGKQESFQKDILNNIFIKLNRDLPSVTITEDSTRLSKIDGNLPKLELWKSFQSLNDKWIAGQDFKTKTIYEDFLFMDRANRPVGDKIVINIAELEGFITGRSDKMSVYSLLGLIYQKNNFAFIPTPAYTNFYGRDERVKEGEPVPQDIPNDLFGTFMEVDTRDSRPRMLGIYIGEPSTNLDMSKNENSRRGDDSFDITNPSNCPLRENQQNKTNYSDSNRCVGFQVDFGRRNQGMFNGISIDMDQHTMIGPTFQVVTDMGQQASGQKVAQQSQSLYNFYKTRSYTCQVQSMGNVMIQPTMYFNLTNVPMFYGPYMITNVSHSITNRGFNTQFQGTRMPKYSLSPPDKLVASVNREILDTYRKAQKQIEDNTPTGSTNNTITLSNLTNIKQGDTEKCQSMTKYPNKTFVNLVRNSVNANTIIEYVNSPTNELTLQMKLFIYGVATLNKATRENVFNNNLIDLPTNKEIRPSTRSQYFNGQTCIENTEMILPIASFNSINDCLDYMISTYKPQTIILDSLITEIEKTSVTGVLEKALTTLYMGRIYELDPIDGTANQMISIVNTKKENNTEYKKAYDKWFGIFKSIVERGI